MDLEKEYNMEDKHSFYVLKFTNFTLETNYIGLELGKKQVSCFGMMDGLIFY